MGKCIALADIDEAQLCSELDNRGGIIQSIIFGYWDDVAKWPTLPAPADASVTPLTLEEAGAWKGDVAMKASTRAYKLVFTDETGELQITEQGDAGSESVKYSLSLERNKMSKKIFGFENATRGRRMFFIVTDKNGISYLLGDELVAAHKVAADASTSGKAVSEANKVPLKFEYTCPRKLVYEGDKVTLLTETPSAGG